MGSCMTSESSIVSHGELVREELHDQRGFRIPPARWLSWESPWPVDGVTPPYPSPGAITMKM